MKWMDYVYLGFFVVAIIILIMQIAGIYLTKKQSKLQLSLADLERLEKYKMAIEILKDFFNVGEINGDYLINPTGFDKLSQMDYELLKEVLDYDREK